MNKQTNMKRMRKKIKAGADLMSLPLENIPPRQVRKLGNLYAWMQTLPDYPRETEGLIIAAEARQRANSLSDRERDERFRAAMVLIYGSRSGEAAAICP